jgi:hypothetical protein
LREWTARTIARRLPRSVAYHATIRVWANETSGIHGGKEEVPAVTVSDALSRW